MKADVVVIGAGAVGSSTARELSRYNLKVVLMEKSEDIGGDASRSNSAMMICGYDTPPFTLENKLVTTSNAMIDQLAEDLDVSFFRIGAIQVAKTEEELPALQASFQQAIDNGVTDVSRLSNEKLRAMEPNIAPTVAGGMFIPRESHIDVFELMVAYVENAVDNGVVLLRGAPVTDILTENKKVTAVVTPKGVIHTRFVVNAAGVYGDTIARMVGLDDFRNYPRMGQFYIMDKNLPYMPNHMLMPVPTPITRGKLLIPTIHGNLLLGPTAINREDRGDKSTDREQLDSVINEVKELIPAINAKDAVTQFAGLRPARDPYGYHIRAFKELKGYIEATGILTGVSGSPAIGVYISQLLGEEGLALQPKQDFNPVRVGIRRFARMSQKERNELIARDPHYGNIICRCETITEGEIVDAIRRTAGARSMDGVKRRLRVGMGRCQGGFCGPRTMEILVRELGIPMEQVVKNEPGSELLRGSNRK